MNYDVNDRHESVPGVEEIRPAPPTSPIDSDIHNHYEVTAIGKKHLSVFSGADLYTTHQLLINNLIEDNDDYIKVLATPGTNFNTTFDDTVYAFLIDDAQAFITFGNKYLFDLLSIDIIMDGVGIKPNNSILKQELELVNFLHAENAGIAVFRGNRNDLTNWTRLSYENTAQVKTDNCT